MWILGRHISTHDATLVGEGGEEKGKIKKWFQLKPGQATGQSWKSGSREGWERGRWRLGWTCRRILGAWPCSAFCLLVL